MAAGRDLQASPPGSLGRPALVLPDHLHLDRPRFPGSGRVLGVQMFAVGWDQNSLKLVAGGDEGESNSPSKFLSCTHVTASESRSIVSTRNAPFVNGRFGAPRGKKFEPIQAAAGIRSLRNPPLTQPSHAG